MTGTAPPRGVDAVHVLLDAAIDYAGLFPPASLPLHEAAAAYAGYLHGRDSWALGRFVVPASQLAELQRAAARLDPVGLRAWAVSVLFDASRDAPLATDTGRVRVVSIEARAGNAREIAQVREGCGSAIECFIEIPVAGEIESLVRAVRDAGAAAKIRTGGVTEAAFPAPQDVVRFIRACRNAGVSFKATAGLHHALRGEYRLTYAPDSARSAMYGFLNVLLAAVLVWDGADDAVALDALEERDPRALRFGGSGMEWRGRALSNAVVAAARRQFVRSFSSCSFREPMDEMTALLEP